MSGEPSIPDPPTSVVASSSVWDRLAEFASRNRKTIIYTTAAFTILLTAGGIWYYTQRSDYGGDAEARRKREKSGKKTRSKKSSSDEETQQPNGDKKVTVEEDIELPEITEESIQGLSLETRKEYALMYKNAGNKTYSSRKFKEAIELYTKAIMCHADPVFYSNRAACYAALKQHDKTIEDASAALALNPDYSKALRRRAHAYEEIANDTQALSDWTAACIVEEFKFADSTNAVQRVLKHLADTKAAECLRNKPRKLPSPNFVLAYLSSFRPKPWPALPEDPSEGDLALQRAFEFIDQTDFNEAADEIDTAIRLGCKYLPLAFNYSGTFAFIRGDPDVAIAELNKSLDLDPNQSQVWAKRASVHMEKGDRTAAMADFDKALEVDGQDPDVYYHRGQVRFLTGDFSDAAADYSKAADLDKKFVYSQVQLGVAQYKLGQVKDSLVTFRKCLKNFKNSAEVYNYYGEVLLDQGNYQEAFDKFETAIELERSTATSTPGGKKVRNIMPLVNRAVLYLQWKKDPKEAERCLREALKLDPESDLAVATLGQLLLQDGRAPEALEYFDKSVELGRTEQELVSALSFAEATRAQLDVTTKYPHLAEKLSKMTAAAQQGGFMG